MTLYVTDTIIDDSKKQVTSLEIERKANDMPQFTDIPTPSLLLDRDRLDSNIQKMAAKISAHQVQLRPHLKTCKSEDVARRILPPAQHAPITVSTLKEAAYFLDVGYTDILYAVSIIPNKLLQVAALQKEGAKITLLLDTLEAAQQVAQKATELLTEFACLIEIDSDGNRAGLKPENTEVLQIAKYLQETANVTFEGVMTHAGGSYACTSILEIEIFAEQERHAITTAANLIRASGVQCKIVSMGSTPTVTFAKSLEGVTEVRAGVYVFQDMVMQSLNVCDHNDIALSVLTSVISHNKAQNRLLIDAGSLALSADPGKINAKGQKHFGQLCTVDGCDIFPDLFVTSCNQEHGLISLNDTGYSFEQFPIGSQLRILPNHACITAAAYPGYHVVFDNNHVEDYWPRCNGW